jgi:hypothetical protein
MTMSTVDLTPEDGALEECLDELDEFVSGLGRYPPALVALALRTHLETLLQALLESKLCTSGEVRVKSSHLTISLILPYSLQHEEVRKHR